jgi:hypothetical protein
MEAALYNDFSGRFPQKFILKEYGISRNTLSRLEQTILKKLQKSTVKEARASYKKKEITDKLLVSFVKSIERPKVGRPTYLTADEEALIVASAEMKGAHSAPPSEASISR